MGGVKSLLIDNDIEFIKHYLRKKKDSTCTSTKCCVNSIQKKEKMILKQLKNTQHAVSERLKRK